MTALIVARTLHFGWIECGTGPDDVRDGIAFTRQAQSQLGWVNVFTELEFIKDHFVDSGHPDLKIGNEQNPGNPAEKAFLARPSTKAHARFLEQWVLNPGANKPSHALTTGAATARADLVAVSGHGYMGTIYGNGAANKMFLAQAFAENANIVSDGRFKYLLVATCGNAGDYAAPLWLSAFERPKPIHGILGYQETYTGDKTGALVMASFVNVMRTNPTFSILSCWELANRGRQEWGAIMFEQAAVQDTVADWHSKAGLKQIAPGSPVRHYTRQTLVGGGKKITAKPSHKLSWIAADGTVIDAANHAPSASPQKAYHPNDAGRLRITNNATTLDPDDSLLIVFYWIRRAKAFSLEKLLDFDDSLMKNDPKLGRPRISKILDAQAQMATASRPAANEWDAIRYTPVGGSSTEDLAFTIKSDMLTKFVDIDDGTHGFIWCEIVIGASGSVPNYADAAFLMP